MSLATATFELLSTELSVGTRVYPMTLPQGATLPAIIYQVISDNPEITHSTAQDAPTYTGTLYHRTRIQFSIYADKYLTMESVYLELLQMLSGFRGVADDIEIQAALPDVTLDDYDPDTKKWRRIVDFILHYQTGGAS